MTGNWLQSSTGAIFIISISRVPDIVIEAEDGKTAQGQTHPAH